MTTNITPDTARELLDGTTPGPWVRHPDQPRALCNLDTRFLVHHEMVTNRGMEPSAEDVANTELIAAAPALAELIANMYYRYAAQVEMYPSPGPQPFLTENGDPTFNDSDIKWFATLEGARRHGGIYAPDDYRVARRLVSRSEVVE